VAICERKGRHSRNAARKTRAAWLLVALLAVRLATPVFAAESTSGQPQTFESLLEGALEAQREGRLADVRASLRDAARHVSGEDGQSAQFHGLLLDAADEYDRGLPQTSRHRLKAATQLINPWFWFGLGLVAQAFFTARFFVQWLASERRGESVIPVAFWYLSIFGSGGLLAYAIWRQDPIIVLGQSFNAFIYVRNLALLRRTRGTATPDAAPTDGGDA